MRVVAVVALIALTGCGGEASKPGNLVGAAEETEADPVDDGKADCRIGGAEEWARDCMVERAGEMLTIRHGDGGFRRFRVLADGRGLEAADGAEVAVVKIVGDQQIEVAAGADRYRLPAQIAGGR
ncbi:MAG: hypothetical protein AABZ73_01655 [Pseudomonadota bacterium]|uniref:hypothetical protein n=1 Tax=Sphingobium sp. TaxID=1912891 RepID=UPI002E1B51E3